MSDFIHSNPSYQEDYNGDSNWANPIYHKFIDGAREVADKGYTKTRLCHEAKVSTNAMAKLGRNEDVRVEVLIRICGVLDCTMDDIMELFPEQKEEN